MLRGKCVYGEYKIMPACTEMAPLILCSLFFFLSFLSLALLFSLLLPAFFSPSLSLPPLPFLLPLFLNIDQKLIHSFLWLSSG